MVKPVQFPAEVESLVRFVEETDPSQIIPQTLAKLRGGVPVKDLLRAGALAVTRSTELPGHHHGGPIHPVAGTYPVWHTHRMLSGETAYLPVLQHVALCNLHCHAPEMGPYIMPELEPLSGIASLDALKASMERGMRMRWGSFVEKHWLWLLEHGTFGEALDAILPRAIARNGEDDHYFIYPSFAARALECIGWEWAKVLMRPPVRYLSHGPFYIQSLAHAPAFAAVEELLTKHKLLETGVKEHTTARETEAIGALAQRIGATNVYAEIPGMVAEALAAGLSLEGAAEALSIGASTIHLRTSYGNPMDVHLHTGINVRRWLLKMPGMSLRNKILLLLSWHSGPEIRLSEKKMDWAPQPDEATLAKLPRRSQPQLLEAIARSIETQPPYDFSTIGPRLDLMVAPPEVKETVALAAQYADAGYDPNPFFVRLAELFCRDDFTEMHQFKFHQAVVEEYYNTREPYRRVHLVSGAKAAAVIYGKKQDTYARARELIKA